MDALLSPRRRHLIAALGAAALGAACGARTVSHRGAAQFGGQTMGSTFSVRLAGDVLDDAQLLAARNVVSAAFDGVVQRMSTYDAQSELERFNRHAATEPFMLTADTMAVLDCAQRVSALSAGAFDVTVAPLVSAWGFGAGATARGVVPPPQSLAAATGWQHLSLDLGAGSARKALPNLRADLSGIAKGYAVDRAALALESLGLQRYMVEAGGEVRTRGLNAQGRPWQIAIERPDAWPQQAHHVVPLQGLAMATSGDYRDFWDHGGRRYSHEIDPVTRAPVQQRLASVSVVHEQCMVADAMATALIVLGLERGLELARAQRLAALFIERTPGGRLRDVASPAFVALG